MFVSELKDVDYLHLESKIEGGCFIKLGMGTVTCKAKWSIVQKMGIDRAEYINKNSSSTFSF